MVGTSSGSKGNAKGKLTDTKLHNAVLKTLCALSQKVREVRGAVFMCWMIKQEAPEYKRPKEQLRAYSEQATAKGKGRGLGPPGVAAFTALLQALSERGSAVGASNAASVASFKQKRDDLEPERTFDLVPPTASWPKFTTLLCAAVSSSSSAWQSIESTFVGQSDKQERIVFSVNLQKALERALSSAIEQSSKKGDFVVASRLISPDRPLARRVDWRKKLRRTKNYWIVQLENFWEWEAVQPPLRWDECLPRLRSRRFGGSRAGPWTWSSVRRKTQHVNCTRKATSDRWQACVHGIRSRRRAVTD